MRAVSVFFTSCLIFGAVTGQAIPTTTDGTTCGTPSTTTGLTTFIIKAASRLGPINNILIKFDTVRNLAVTSTAVQDDLNAEKNVTRGSEPFGPLPCPQLPVPTSQQNCTGGFSMTATQQTKSGRFTWDRGHMTPANPMRFSDEALDKTFFCVNIAPQDSYTNQNPWREIEVGSENKLKATTGIIMTGLCSANNDLDGTKTYRGFTIPQCFWKLVCYKDKTTGVTKVVGFVGDNTLVNFSDTVARAARDASTKLPRSQQEILALLTKPELVDLTWKEAAQNLTPGRQVSRLPLADDCIKAKVLAQDTLDEWAKYIG